MKRKAPLTVILCAICLSSLILLTSQGQSPVPDYGLPPPPESASHFEAEAREELALLSPEDKCGQVLLIGIEGRTRPGAAARALIRELGPGGVILFADNIGTDTAALGGFIAGLQDAAAESHSGLPLIVSIDHEGGTVFRFKKGVTAVPSAASVGGLGLADGPRFAALLGRRAGLELRALGINLALAPVVETGNDENARFLGTRVYGRDPALVDLTAGAYIRGLESAGVGAAAKHFPGNAASDPHKRLSSIKASREELDTEYFARFAAARDSGVSCILLSHVLVPALDSAEPATLSPVLIQDELRGRLGFEGLAVTDDLYMGALMNRMKPEKSAVAALKAGADLLMLTEDEGALQVKKAIQAALVSGDLPESRLDEAVLRVLELKLRFNMADGFDSSLRAERLAGLPGIAAESGKEIAEFKAELAQNSQKTAKNSH